MNIPHRTLLLSLLAGSVLSPAANADDTFTVSADGGIRIGNADKSATFQLGGRLQYDFDATRSDDNGVDTRDFDVRRARIDVKGNVGDWGYKAQFNVAESDGAQGGNAEDLYIQYLGFGERATITIGKQQEPFGLERVESDNDTASLERTAVTELMTPQRTSGVKLDGVGPRWTYAIGVFEAQGNGTDDYDRVALTGRATYTPVLAGTTVVHLGANYMHRPGTASVGEFTVYGIEAAFNHGPFHVQGEYLDGTRGHENLGGGYVEAGWTLSGETRPYKNGVFQRIVPGTATGAWELVLRYERGDGNYADVGLAGTQMYDGTQVTAGVNWYASKNARLGLSYMKGEASNATGTSFDGNELRARFQYVF